MDRADLSDYLSPGRERPRARARRGRGPGLRHRLRHADLARSGQAHAVRDDHLRRDRRGPGLQRGSVRGAVRRRARGAGPAAQRLDPRPVAPDDPGGVRGGPPAHERRRVRGPRVRRGPDRARNRLRRPPGQLQGQARDRARHPAGRGGERPRHRRRRQGRDGRSLEVLPRGDEGRLPVRHDAVRARGDRGGREDPSGGDRPRVPRHVPLPRKPPGDAHSDDRGTGGDPRDVRGPGRCSASRSTC